MKQARIILSTEAEKTYLQLKERSGNKTERMILDAVHKKTEQIKKNPHYGDPIAKRLIPEEYTIEYGIGNLFRVELPAAWRLLYTLTSKEDELIAFIIDLVDHSTYDKKFGYRKR
jgi:hypothetical protein